MHRTCFSILLYNCFLKFLTVENNMVMNSGWLFINFMPIHLPVTPKVLCFFKDHLLISLVSL